MEQLEWNVQREPTTGEDTFAETVVQHVLDGNSCCVTGPPGSGKSHLLGQLRDGLEAAAWPTHGGPGAHERRGENNQRSDVSRLPHEDGQ